MIRLLRSKFFIIRTIAGLSLGMGAGWGISFLSPPIANAQAGFVCPDNGAIVVQFQGSTFTGFAVETEGVGFNSTYQFSAIDLAGNVIVGEAQASIVDCITAPSGGFVDLHDVKITGFSSGGPSNV